MADLARIRELWNALDARAEHFLAAAGFPRERVTARYQLNLRYPGQNWSLPVDVAEKLGPRELDFVDEAMRDRIVADFHARHEREYGHARLAEEPEITGVRLLTRADIGKPEFRGGLTTRRQAATPGGTRRANLGEGFTEVAVHHGPSLEPGDVIESPAIVEETFTTIAVYPGWEAVIDDAGDYLLQSGLLQSGLLQSGLLQSSG